MTHEPPPANDEELERHLKTVAQDLSSLATALYREFHHVAPIRQSAHALERSAGQLNLRLLDRQLRRKGR